MSANINDKLRGIRNGGSPQPTTVSIARAIGATSLTTAGLTNWFTDTPVDFVTYKKYTSGQNAGQVNRSTLCGWKGIVSGNAIVSMVLVHGTDVGNGVGDFVDVAQTDAWGQGVYDWGIVSHNVDGTLKDKIATLPKINGGTTAGVLQTDASGNVTSAKVAAPNVDSTTIPKFSADKSTSTQTIGTTPTKVTFNSETYDVGNNYDAANSRFTAPIAGTYSFNAQVYIVSPNTSTAQQMQFYKNGVAVYTIFPKVSGTYQTSGIKKSFVLAAGDYIEVYANALNNSMTTGQETSTSASFFEGSLTI